LPAITGQVDWAERVATAGQAATRQVAVFTWQAAT
jgi:hypothetical protein